jgi:hypothetical protein
VKKIANFWKKRKSVTFLYICSKMELDDAIAIAKEEAVRCQPFAGNTIPKQEHHPKGGEEPTTNLFKE